MPPVSARNAEMHVREFTIRPDALELEGPEGVVRLPPKAMGVLVLLADRAKDVVSKDELIDVVWESAAVTDQVLGNAIWQLRRALADHEATLIETVPRRGYRLTATPRASSTKPGVALLPLRDDSAEGSNRSELADGLTEALITELAGSSEFRVIARASVEALRGIERSPSEIAAQLRVDHVITGAIFRSGRRLRATVQLVSKGDDSVRWSQSVERNLDDVLVLQSELSASLAGQIESTLKSSSPRDISVDPDAYESYLAGRYLIAQSTYDPINEGLRQLEELSAEFDFAPLWAALARGYYQLASWGQAPGAGLLEHCARAARRALDRDPQLVEARVLECASVGFGAEAMEGMRARLVAILASRPDDWNALDAHARALAAGGKIEQATVQARRALETNPMSPYLLTAAAMFHRLAGHHSEAISLCERALEIASDWSIAHLERGRALLAAGHLTAASESIGRAEPAWGEYVARMERGDRDGAKAQLQEWTGSDDYVAPYWLAERASWLDEHDIALDALERAVEEGQLHARFFAVEPTFASLHDDQRFRDLRARTGL